MRDVGRGILGSVGLFISGAGATFLLNPNRAAAKFLLEADSVTALSNIRAFIGAPVLALGIAVIIAAITEKLDNARAGALFLILLLVARATSIVVDGTPEGIGYLMGVPFVALVLMIAAHKMIDSGKHAQGSAGAARQTA